MRLSLWFMMVVTATAFCDSTMGVCPESLKYEIEGDRKALLIRRGFEDWDVLSKGSFQFVGPTLYTGHPSTETVEAGPELNVWGSMDPVRLDREYASGGWVACEYSGTPIRYVAELPADVTGCEFLPNERRLRCVRGAKQEPEAVISGARTTEILVLASVKSCDLNIDGIAAGRLESDRARAFFVRAGARRISCAKDDGQTSERTLNLAPDQELGYWLKWQSEEK
jgi:hypothetical protein